jgi:CheY-like chemotaxis protein
VRRPDDPIQAPSEVRISVRDIGVGIDASMLPRVFDMFTQAGSGTEHGRGGLGIGLTIAKNLVEMHDGRIEVHSAGQGRGSEFVIYLPTAPPGLGLPTDEDKGEPAPQPAKSRLRVLVVDDNADQVQSLSTLLRLLGHDVEVASDGPAALETVERVLPDMALIDIGLPGMNGYDLARFIRERPHLSNLFLVAQTGWGQDSDRAMSEKAGFDEHVVKPVALETLERVIGRAESHRHRPQD